MSDPQIGGSQVVRRNLGNLMLGRSELLLSALLDPLICPSRNGQKEEQEAKEEEREGN